VIVFFSHLRVWFVSCVFLVPTFSWQSSSTEENKPVAIWFALSDSGRGKLSFEPFAQVTQGKLASIPDACKEDDPKYRKFSERYLKSGTSYEARAGGAAAGKVSLTPSVDALGNYEATYTGTARIRGRVMALATTLSEISGRENKRQAPTASERAATIKLATELYQQAGVPESALPDLIVVNLTRTILKPATEPSFIGSFTIEERITPEETRYDSLFFVASFLNGELKPELSEMHLSLDDKDLQSLGLVDQADMFDSGQDNLVLQLGFYENYRYRVYGRAKDGKHWERIFETETMGCL